MVEKKEEAEQILYFALPDGTLVELDPEVVERYNLKEGEMLPLSGYVIQGKSKTRWDDLKLNDKVAKAMKK